MSGSDVIVELESLLQLQGTSISPQHALAASRLLDRLCLKKKREHEEPAQSKVPTSSTGAQPSPLHGKHIMLSYNHANKARVVELSKALKAAGYDTWKDEEIVGGVHGATGDRMPEAVEKSSHVIICISRDYKQSANCRQEALYAKKLCEKKQLQLLFVIPLHLLLPASSWNRSTNPPLCHQLAELCLHRNRGCRSKGGKLEPANGFGGVMETLLLHAQLRRTSA